MKLNNRLINFIAVLFLLFVAGSCEHSWEIEERDWELTWQDEFDIDGAPDPTKWACELGGGGWGNAELQRYTDESDNIRIEEGVLKITAQRNGNMFTSARLISKGLFEQTYGRFEARIRLPYGPGIWPAFWLLGNDIDAAGWPQCGEIDIMEFRGQQPNIVHGSLHGPGYSGGSPITKSYGFENDRLDKDYHIFAIEWGEDFIHYYVDDRIYQEITFDEVEAEGDWVFDHPFYILLNLAVGGNYVGFPTDSTPFPQTMFVDWVRVYKEVQ
ncbi:MAG TPA: glycoside hydrolase family 16 protein [Bacteroidales bacterium]|nr:glycoside hydrolase family 16 protein [Bacteroidales bacterium]